MLELHTFTVSLDLRNQLASERTSVREAKAKEKRKRKINASVRVFKALKQTSNTFYIFSFFLTHDEYETVS